MLDTLSQKKKKEGKGGGEVCLLLGRVPGCRVYAALLASASFGPWSPVSAVFQCRYSL